MILSQIVLRFGFRSNFCRILNSSSLLYSKMPPKKKAVSKSLEKVENAAPKTRAASKSPEKAENAVPEIQEEKPKKGKKTKAAADEEAPAVSKSPEKAENAAPETQEEKPKKGKKTKAAADEEAPAVSKSLEKVENAAPKTRAASKSPEKAENAAPETQEEKPKKGKKTKAAADEEAPAASKSPEKVENAAPEIQEEKPKKGKRTKAAADEETPPAKKSKADKAEAKTKLRKEASLTDGMDFSHDCQTKDGRKPNLKIASWNINGIRAWMDKGGLSYLKDENPDILCVQETKCAEADLPDDVKVDGYHDYWSSAEQAGYAGTGIYSKTEPINVTYGLGIEKHDTEGRVITAEYDNYYLVTAYVPNSGRGLPRLPYRSKQWDVDFRNYLNELNKKKPIIMCGDLNVAHLEIDLANPKTNKKTAGFTVEERQGFTDLIAEGYIDSYRELYPDTEGAYTFWTYMGNARAKNVGWRLDYFVLSEKLKEDLCDNVIRKGVMGSDHCPIVLYMAMK